MRRAVKLWFLALLALVACRIADAPDMDAAYGWRAQLYLAPDTVQLAPGDSVEIYGYYVKPSGDTVAVAGPDLFWILVEGGVIHGYDERWYVAGDTACVGHGGCRVWAEDHSRNKEYPPAGEMIVQIQAAP